jgi:hypothetical protein
MGFSGLGCSYCQISASVEPGNEKSLPKYNWQPILKTNVRFAACSGKIISHNHESARQNI